MDEILDRTGVAIISKGTYVPAGKKPEMGERKLYLIIEGESDMSVKQAKLEIQRLLEEETMKIGTIGMISTGRYSVL